MANTIVKTKGFKDLFKSLGYTKNQLGRYQKRLNNILIEFDVLEGEHELGTYIEIRQNNEFLLTGYWHGPMDLTDTLGQIGIV